MARQCWSVWMAWDRPYCAGSGEREVLHGERNVKRISMGVQWNRKGDKVMSSSFRATDRKKITYKPSVTVLVSVHLSGCVT